MTSTLERNDLRFTFTPAGTKAWREQIQLRANAMIGMRGGLQLYVSEPFAELSQHDSSHAFMRVHVVSSTEDEHERVINVPTLDRLIPVVNIAAIAPVAEGLDL